MRDQRRAVNALQLAAAQATPVATPGTAVRPAEGPSDAAEEAADNAEAARDPNPKPAGTPAAARDAHHVASVERGRIATMGGVVALIYLVILILMVWR
jgi:hypothetical protein